jgi:GR25 family glycosyltransferase involved in LPS biosynthesis
MQGTPVTDGLTSTPAAAPDQTFIPVYVISLPDAEVRRRNMTTRLGSAGIPFKFFDAPYGRTRQIPEHVDGAVIVRDPFRTESEIACTLSHRHVHRMIAEADADAALIFEDDARLPEDFVQIVRSALSFDFDVFKFEGTNASKRRVTIGRIGSYEVVVSSVPSMGAAAYLVRREAARRICSLPVIDQINDALFGDPRLRLRVLEMAPFCVQPDNETPTQLRERPIASYVPPKRHSVRRFVQSVRRKAMIGRVHGPGILARLEFQRIERWLKR